MVQEVADQASEKVVVTAGAWVEETDQASAAGETGQGSDPETVEPSRDGAILNPLQKSDQCAPRTWPPLPSSIAQSGFSPRYRIDLVRESPLGGSRGCEGDGQ